MNDSTTSQESLRLLDKEAGESGNEKKERDTNSNIGDGTLGYRSNQTNINPVHKSFIRSTLQSRHRG